MRDRPRRPRTGRGRLTAGALRRFTCDIGQTGRAQGNRPRRAAAIRLRPGGMIDTIARKPRGELARARARSARHGAYSQATLGRRRVPVRASVYGGHLCVAVPHERSAALHDQPLTIALDPVIAITCGCSFRRTATRRCSRLRDSVRRCGCGAPVRGTATPTSGLAPPTDPCPRTAGPARPAEAMALPRCGFSIRRRLAHRTVRRPPCSSTRWELPPTTTCSRPDVTAPQPDDRTRLSRAAPRSGPRCSSRRRGI